MKTAHRFSVSYFVRRNREINGLVPIFLRITLNGKSIDVTVQQKIQLCYWDTAKGFGKGKNSEVQKLNLYLEQIRSKIVEIFKELNLRDNPFTVEDLKNRFLGIEEQKHTLMSLFDYHQENSQNILSVGTLKHYKVSKRYYQMFLKSKYHISDIHLSQINYKFITDFEAFVRQENFLNPSTPCKNNTIMKHLERLRKVINLAIKNEWLEKDPFAKFKVSFTSSNREYLTAEELQRIEEKQFSVARLEHIKDMFIFSCYTGLAYIDIFNLTKQNICIGIDGEAWISTSRTKTDKPVRIPILPKAQAIIEKYNTNPLVINKGKLLPMMSNQKTNSYLKEIADMCGIDKQISFHVARHTFATTITLTNGVPIETVSKLLGHTSISTTQIYAKVIESKVSDDMKLLRNKLDVQSPIKSRISI